MENNWKIGAIAGLDGTQSRNQLNSDIKGLSRNLDKLKLYAEIDKNQVAQLQQQLKKLQIELNNVTVSDTVINGLVAKINAGLQNVNIGNVNIGNQAQQVGQQIGNNIVQGVASGVNKAKSELKSFSDLTNFSELNKKIEHLQIDPSALKNYNAILDEVKAKYAEFGQVKITNEQFDNGILEKFKVNIEQVNGDLKETKSFMMSLNDDKDAFVFDGIIKGSESIVQHLDKTKNAVNQTAEAINALKDKAKVDKIQHSLNIGDYDVQLKTFETALKKASIEGTELENKLNGVKTALNNLKTSATGDNIIPDTVIENARLLDIEIEKISNDIKSIKLDNSLLADDIRVNDTITKLNEQLRKNGNYSIEAKEKIEAWIKELENGNVAIARLKEINSESKALHHQMANMGKVGKSFWQTLTSSWQKFAEWTIATTSFMDVIYVFRKAITEVKELDTALIDLKKTANMSAKELDNFYYSSNDVAKQMGVTTKEIIDQASAWARLGYNTSETATQMAKLSSMFKLISPGMTSDEATSGLVSIMKAYDLEVNDVLDGIMSKVNVVGNKFALSNSDIIAMLQDSVSAMAEGNNTLEETIALETAAFEIAQDRSVGNGFKTVALRLRGINEETQELDDSLKTISGDLYDLTGVSVMQDTDTYKSTYQILKDMYDVWDDLSDKTQAEALEMMFGKQRANVGAAVLKNFEAAEKAMEEMAKSAGNAEAEMSVAMDSIEYKLNILGQTGTAIAQNLFSRDDMKAVLDTINVLGSSIQWLTDKLGLFGSIGLGAGLFAGIKNVG